MSAQQYVNAARDLLNLDAIPTIDDTTDIPQYGLFSDPLATISGDLLINALYPAANRIVGQLKDNNVQQLAGCASGASDSDCAMRFAQNFGAKAFRRPLAATEVTRLMTVFKAGATTDFNTGINLMIKALILAPSFLYRTELGPDALAANAAGDYPDVALTPYEVATQLGFTFLNSTPDAALLAAAANGGLATAAGITTEVSRLLTSPAGHVTTVALFGKWFGLARLADQTKDSALLSRLALADQNQLAIIDELTTSITQFLDTTLWGTADAPITDLLTSQKVFLNSRLARLYDVALETPTTTGFVSATWPATQQRVGILSQPAFLWAASNPARTSIIQRGQLIHDRFVCQDPLPPPIDLSTPEALSILAMGDSEITQSDARLNAGKTCADMCHSQMDPYARVLQNFDPIGNYRTVDEVGRPVVPTATFTGQSPLAPMTVSGPSAFAQALIATKRFSACAVQQVSSYAQGSMIYRSNTCEVQALAAAFNQSDGTVSSLLKQVAAAPFVRARTGGSK